MNIIQDLAKLEAGLLKDIDELKRADPNFRICIVSQTSKQAVSIKCGFDTNTTRVEDQESNRFRQLSD